jgi:hypothetical protein
LKILQDIPRDIQKQIKKTAFGYLLQKSRYFPIPIFTKGPYQCAGPEPKKAVLFISLKPEQEPHQVVYFYILDLISQGKGDRTGEASFCLIGSGAA